MSAAISVLLTARDEEEQLPAALASVAGWVRETLVVVDPRTVDATREVARAAGARVLEHPFSGQAEQWNWGLEQCGEGWGLVLDADERVSERLRRAIVAALDDPHCPAYSMRRSNFAFGRKLRFGDWGADRVVRLVAPARVRFAGRVHARALAEEVGALAGELEHHTLRSLEQYMPKLLDYSLRGSSELLAAGRRASLASAVARANWRFVRAYVLRLGLLDGAAGLAVAMLAAYGTFLKWARVWQVSAGR